MPDFFETVARPVPSLSAYATKMDVSLVLAELPPLRVTPSRSIPGSKRQWPDYGRCLDGAPINSA
jgi:hypothetical protein